MQLLPQNAAHLNCEPLLTATFRFWLWLLIEIIQFFIELCIVEINHRH